MPKKSRKRTSAPPSQQPSGSGSGSVSSSSTSSSSDSLPTPPALVPTADPPSKPPFLAEPASFRPPGLLWASPGYYPTSFGPSGQPWAYYTPLTEQHIPELTALEPRDGRCSPAAVSVLASRPPSPAASIISSSSRDSSDSAVILESDARSKASHVTSISIPPSIAPPPPELKPSLPSLGSSWFCHAPVPSKPLLLRSLSAKTTRHSQFYFTDDLITLNVDGCLFRVHRYFLERESTYFKKLFAREVRCGQSDETAIELPQVTVEAFEILLRFVYFGTHEPTTYSIEDWISLLSAATSLSFPQLRERALSELESPTTCLDAFDRLLLADRFEIDRWRCPAYVELCMREHPLQESEVTMLGVKVASQIAQAREKVLLDMLLQCQGMPRMDKAGNWVVPRPTKDAHRVAQIVEDVFWPNGVPVPLRP